MRPFLLVFKGQWEFFFWFSWLLAFVFFIFWVIHFFDLKSLVEPDTIFKRVFIDFCHMDIVTLPFIGTTLAVPIFINLLSPWRCLEYKIQYTDDPLVSYVPSSFDDGDPYDTDNAMQCGSPTHVIYLLFSIIGLLTFVPTSLFSRPQWQYLGRTQLIFEDRFLMLTLFGKYLLATFQVFFGSTDVYAPGSVIALQFVVIGFVIIVLLVSNLYYKPCKTLDIVNHVRTVLLSITLWSFISGIVAHGINDEKNPTSGLMLVFGDALVLIFGILFVRILAKKNPSSLSIPSNHDPSSTLVPLEGDNSVALSVADI